jgi:hypothetical protein
MRTNNFISECGYLRPRVVAAIVLCGAGALLAGLSLGALRPSGVTAPVATSANYLALAPTHSDLVTENAVGTPSGIPLAATQTPGWSIVKSPNINSGQQQHSVDDVTCVSASDCWAVGWYVNDQYILQTIIERWNGSTWSVVPSRNTSTTHYNLLSAVTCTSAADCWAVGYYYNARNVEQTFIEHWNGTSWSIVTSPNTALPNVLNAVTCASASDCWAVGTTNQFATEGVPQTLIEHWNGSSWAIVNSPNTSTTQGNSLFGVTCASASDCWAVGNHWSSSGILTLIEHWNGVSWSIARSPNATGVNVNELSSVTCASGSDCWAVGDRTTSGYYQTLIIHWNGFQWKIVTSPNPSVEQDTFLNGVTCGSASDCWAVGSTDYYHPLIERWNGTSWAVITGADVGPGQSVLHGVACSAVSQCWTVGYSTPPHNTPQTLIERWDGTSWTRAKSANKNIGTRANDLFDVGCASSSDCWAVGYYTVDSTTPNISFGTRTLILHWDGNLWRTASSPSVVNHDNLLTGVTCTSTSDCWAVGYIPFSPSQSLIEHWDGRRWTIVTSPDNGRLNDVTCASASDCWAVGSYYNATFGDDQPLTVRWNGISWSIVNSPSASVRYSELYGVTCTGASNCWAVGYYLDANFNSQTFIEHWNGTKWTVVQSQNASTSQSNLLQDVTCASATDCWAVGQYFNGNAQQTLIERWRGSRWTIVASPNTSATQDNVLSGVTCASGSPCFAVGHYRPSTASQTLIEQWNGTSWTIVSSPNTSAEKTNSLNRVTCTSDSTCWVVGDRPGGIYDYKQTLIEKYSPSASP